MKIERSGQPVHKSTLGLRDELCNLVNLNAGSDSTIITGVEDAATRPNKPWFIVRVSGGQRFLVHVTEITE